MTAIELTADTCHRVTRTIRMTFSRLDIDIEGTPLGAELAAIDDLAASPLFTRSSAHAASDGPPPSPAPFLKAVRCRLVAEAVARCRFSPGFDLVLRHIRNLSVESMGGGETQAWDQLVEVETGARLLCADMPVKFAEPDVVVTDEDGKPLLPIACKRPRSVSAIDKACRKAIRQIEDAGSPGVALLYVDGIVATPDPNLPPDDVRALMARQVEVAQRIVSDRQQSDPWHGFDATRGNAVGAIVICSALAVARRADGRHVVFPCFAQKAIRNRSIALKALPRRADFIKVLTAALRFGHSRLVAHGGD